jgi:hypothetical protein
MMFAAEKVMWVQVPRPVFDLVGVVLYSLGLAALCAVIAVTLGSFLGLVFIVRRRRRPHDLWAERSLQLLEPRP